MALEWKGAHDLAPGHLRAITPHGEYLAGPCRHSGEWEYCTPDHDWGEHEGHGWGGLTREQALAAAEADLAKRG